MGRECDFAGNEDGDNNVFHFTFRSKGQDQDSPDYKRTLVQLTCTSGAYNLSSIYLMRDDTEASWELLSFAEPVADYDYADENFSRLKAPPRVSGYVSVTQMTNSKFAPESRTISAAAKWRGVGDAWSAGKWQFEDGVFILKKYEMDPTYQPPGDEGGDPQMPESYVLFDATKPSP
jgi:hypothetical protein